MKKVSLSSTMGPGVKLARRALEGHEVRSWRLSSKGQRRSPIRRSGGSREGRRQLRQRQRQTDIVGGSMGGQRLDSGGVKALADMPSLNELRSKLVGMLQTPATRIATVLQAPAGQLARVMAPTRRRRSLDRFPAEPTPDPERSSQQEILNG
jgi:large subunit ribosomal protein L10